MNYSWMLSPYNAIILPNDAIGFKPWLTAMTEFFDVEHLHWKGLFSFILSNIYIFYKNDLLGCDGYLWVCNWKIKQFPINA